MDAARCQPAGPARALLAGDGIAAIGADITRPADVLADPELARVIDFGQPICVILAAVLHFQPAEVARSLIAEYAAPLAAGSALLASVFSAADEEFRRNAAGAYTAAQWHSHSPAELERWLREAGLRPLRGHVGNVSAWPLDPPGRTASLAEAIGDLAEKLLPAGGPGEIPGPDAGPHHRRFRSPRGDRRRSARGALPAALWPCGCPRWPPARPAKRRCLSRWHTTSPCSCVNTPGSHRPSRQQTAAPVPALIRPNGPWCARPGRVPRPAGSEGDRDSR
jgi:hypothetical protein